MPRFIPPIFIFLSCTFSTQAQQSATISVADLHQLIGEWDGTLTFLSYKDNQYNSIEAQLKVKMGSEERVLECANHYPNDASFDGSYQLSLNELGTSINENQVVERTMTEDGKLRFIVEFPGKDNRKKGTIRNVYTVDDRSLSISKEVLYKKSTIWLKRNEYQFTR